MGYRDDLWELAIDQDGRVVTWQARQIGIPAVEVPKLAHRGGLTRLAQGVYRFDVFPSSRHQEYWRAVLWAGPGAVLSHETALAVRDLCDINPVEIDVTVPRARRLRRAEPVARVHHQDLAPEMLGWWEGLPTVTAEAAVVQGMSSGVPFYLLSQAIETARRGGSVTTATAARLRDSLTASVESGADIGR